MFAFAGFEADDNNRRAGGACEFLDLFDVRMVFADKDSVRRAKGDCASDFCFSIGYLVGRFRKRKEEFLHDLFFFHNVFMCEVVLALVDEFMHAVFARVTQILDADDFLSKFCIEIVAAGEFFFGNARSSDEKADKIFPHRKEFRIGDVRDAFVEFMGCFFA